MKQGRTEGRRLSPAALFPVSCFPFPVSRFLPSCPCLLSPVVTFSLQHQHIMTDLRAQTFRLTQFARCAG